MAGPTATEASPATSSRSTIARCVSPTGWPRPDSGASTRERGSLRRLAALFRRADPRPNATNLDLPELADDVVADRRTLSNVIDQIAVATPDDQGRRNAVAELQRLVVARSAAKA